MSTKSGKKVRKKTVAIFISGVAAVTVWILIATLFFDAPLRLIIATQQDGYQYEEYQESDDPQYPSYTDNDGYGYGETENDDYGYGETENDETENDDYGYGETENDETDNDDYGYGETENDETENDDYGYGETENDETDNDDYGYGETENDVADDCDCHDDCDEECACECGYNVNDENDDAYDCTCECEDDCDEDCDCECDDCNENDAELPPGGNSPELDMHELDARITYLTNQVSHYQMQLLLLNNRLFELNVQLIAARGAANQSAIDALESEIAYVTAQIDELDELLLELEERLAHYMYLRDGVVVQPPSPEIEVPIQQLLSQIQELTIYIDTLAVRFAQLAEARDVTDCGHEGEYLDAQMHALQQQSYSLVAQVETLAQQVQDLMQSQQRAMSFSVAVTATDIEQLQLNDLDSDMYELEYSLSYYLALLEGIFGIMPFAAGPSIYTPDSIQSMNLPFENFVEVNSDATLRGALTTAGVNPLVIRVTSGFNITGTGVIATSGGATNREIHIYSYSPDSHVITRSAGTTRHFDVTRDVHLHLYNVTLTQTGAGATANRGGVSVSGAGARLYMHARSLITNNQAQLGGGAVLSGSSAQLVMNNGSRIYNNRAVQTTSSDRFGGGVHVTGGQLIMNAGSAISNNHTAGSGTGAGHGGGVRMTGGSLTMHGGTISDNTTRQGNGGGVSMTGGSVTMNNGYISDNTASGGGGGGINISGGSVTMNGGYISGNTASGRGGGINISGGTVTLNEDAVVHDNESNHPSAAGPGSGGGGGVSVNSGDPVSTLNVNGATISNNRALRGHGGGIQVAAGETGARAVLNINSINLLNNEARRAGTEGGNGGGIHSNGHSTITISGVSIIEGNRAHNGGAMRIFSGVAQNFTLGAGSRIVNNIATNNGAGISIGHLTTSNANNIGFRVNGTAANPVIFEGNIATGIGGAIHHEGPNITDEARGLHITHAIFRNNRASNGGAISLVLGNNTNNLPPAAAITNSLRISNTTFEGNSATNGLLVDENLAARNLGNSHFVNGQVGSAVWLGPRTDINGNVLAVELRNHIWNNYDVITRNRLEARNVTFHPIGTAAATSTMSARLTQTNRSTNHTSANPNLDPFIPGNATTGPHPLSEPMVLANNDAVIRNSLTAYTVNTYPWNAQIVHWVNTQTTRTFIPGNLAATPPVDGIWQEHDVATTIPNTTTTLTDIAVAQHTLIQPRIDYIYHPITFTVYPTATLGRLNDSAGNVTTVERQLRQSRSQADHDADTDITRTGDRGNPIGTTPAIAESAPWRFVEWRLGSPTGPVVTQADIEATYVSGPLTFYAIFSDMWLVTFDPDGGTFPQGGDVYCDDPVIQEVINGELAIAPTPPPVKENYFFVGWYYDDNGDLVEWNFNTPIDRDITLIAVWTPAITEVTVSKRVSGSMADFGRYFSFTLTLTCEDGLPLPPTTEIFYVISCGDASTCSIGCQCDFRQGLLGNPPTPREVDLQNGTFQFWLRHMQSITFYDVPANARIQVVEGDYPLYITWIYVDGNTATQVNGNSFGPHVVVDALDGLHLQFNNDRGTIVPAGAIIGNTGITFIFFGAVLAAALVAFVIISRRKKELL